MKKILKYLGFILGALLLIFVILAFVLPTEHEIIVDKTMDAPNNMVYNAFNDVRAQIAWSPWKEMDETVTYTTGNRLVGKGASYTWTSEKYGNGEYKIIDTDPDTGINTLTTFDGNKAAESLITINPNGKKSEVSLIYTFESARFANVLMPIRKIGMKRIFKKSLQNVELLVQRRLNTAEYYGYNINEELGPIQFYITNRAEVNKDKTQQFFASKLGPLFTTVQKSNIEMVGQPRMLIYNFKSDENKIDMAAAIPVSENITIPNTSNETIQPGKTVTVDFAGDYSKIRNAHDAIQSYLTDRELVHNWPVIEENIADKKNEEDPNNLHIKITYPVAN